MLYNLHFFPPSKCRLFHNATLFGFCITHILNTGCAKIWKKKKSVAKRLILSSGLYLFSYFLLSISLEASILRVPLQKIFDVATPSDVCVSARVECVHLKFSSSWPIITEPYTNITLMENISLTHFSHFLQTLKETWRTRELVSRERK